MNYGYNIGGCGCNFTPYNNWGGSACGSFQPQCGYGCNYGGFGGGSSWFAIVLVVFLLLIICGCSRVC